MNNKRRNETKKAIEGLTNELSAVIEKYHEIFEALRDEEQECFDNMPEGLQYSERGEKMEEIISCFDEVIGNLEDVSTVTDNMGIDSLVEEAEIEMWD